MHLVLSRKGGVRLDALAALMAACALLTAPGFAAAAKPKAATAALTGVVNVNTASAEELAMLPGVGETRAQAIVAAGSDSDPLSAFTARSFSCFGAA